MKSQIIESPLVDENKHQKRLGRIPYLDNAILQPSKLQIILDRSLHSDNTTKARDMSGHLLIVWRLNGCF